MFEWLNSYWQVDLGSWRFEVQGQVSNPGQEDRSDNFADHENFWEEFYRYVERNIL